MKKIQSTNNGTVKLIRSLKQSKFRKETNLYVIEGKKIIKEAMETCLPEYIIYSASYNDGYFNFSEDNSIVVPDKIFDTLCDTKSPQGILAVMKIAEMPCEIESGIIVALESVQNPLNVGTIIRTADALGAAGVILSPDCADVYSPKVLRGTMGSVYHLPIIRCDDFYKVLEGYKSSGFKIVAGDLRGTELKPVEGNSIMVIGNEGNGITDKLRNMCDVLWKINMPGKAESLNAAVAAGIMLYTLTN